MVSLIPPSRWLTPLRRLYAVLVIIFVLGLVLWLLRDGLGPWASDWMPNVGIGALTILFTVAFVDRILAAREKEASRDRVEQALRRISGGLYTLADFLVWDYAAMHGDRYERPPATLRQLLGHWKAGVATRDRPWPEDLHTLVGTEAIARHLEEQIDRHERVLDHRFVAAGYAFIRSERIGRNMYRDEGDHYDEDGWKSTALESLADDVARLLDVFEPYAQEYLGPDWELRISDDAIDSAELVSGHRREGPGRGGRPDPQGQ